VKLRVFKPKLRVFENRSFVILKETEEILKVLGKNELLCKKAEFSKSENENS
jgi:hypothetical protein